VTPSPSNLSRSKPPIRATAGLLKWPLDVMPNCVICIRLPAVAGGLGLVFIVMTALRVIHGG
jgi:hypothetical protein